MDPNSIGDIPTFIYASNHHTFNQRANTNSFSQDHVGNSQLSLNNFRLDTVHVPVKVSPAGTDSASSDEISVDPTERVIIKKLEEDKLVTALKAVYTYLTSKVK